MKNTHDILIIGGGMVGASLAVALGGSGLRVGVVEARPYGAPGQPSYDDRSVALAYGSRQILESMGAWSALETEAEPIHRIHVSDRGHFGATRLNRDEEGVAALGYVVENRVIGRVLSERMAAQKNIELIAPARLREFHPDEEGVEVEIDADGESQTLRCRLLVAADGTRSPVREQLGIEATVEDYAQIAIIANITPERDHQQVAYERFTEHGPIALLPMSEGRCSLVWTHTHEQAQATLALDDEAFLEKLQQRFGYRLGRFVKVGKRASYPLALVRAKEDIRPRVALIGNASHTLHPVAGQGFNLALRDVAVLAELLLKAQAEGADVGATDLLETYAAARQRDLNTVVRYTDGLARLFANPWGPLGHARAAGLLAVDMITPLRKLLARQSMGLRGRLPRLD